MSRRPVQSEILMWQPKIAGRTHDVPLQMHAGAGVFDSRDQQTHVYLGMGEERLASRSTVRTLGEYGLNAVAVVLNFQDLPCTPENIERTLIEAPHVVAATLRQRAESVEPPDLLLHSQGGGVVMAASEAPMLFDSVAAISPVGLTSEVFGENDKEKRTEFLKRLLLENTLLADQNPLLHPGNIPAGYEIMSRIISDAIHRRTEPKLSFGLNADAAEHIKKIIEAGNRLAIFAGEDDPLFRVMEYAEALIKAHQLTLALGDRALDDVLRVVPNTSHSSPLTPAGKKQLQVASNWLLEA